MSRVVSAQLEGKRLERYEVAEEKGDAPSKSEFLRRLLDDGLDAREKSTYEQAGLSQPLAARLEDEKGFYQDDVEILHEVIEEGLVARRGDALDAIGAGDELREFVEARREEGESLDDTVRRLIREGGERDRVVDMVHRLGTDQAMAVPVTALLLAFIPWLGAWLLQSTNVEIAVALFILGAVLQFAAAVGIVIVALASVASGAAYYDVPRRIMSALGR